MADLEKTVAIIFEGVDQMGAGVTSATRSIDGFANRVETAVAPLASLTRGILAAEAAAATLAIAYGVTAYNAAIEFEAAQADLAKVLDDSEGSVSQFTREITELSNTYGESSTTLLQTMTTYKQAGFTAEESLGLVRAGLDLVIAGDIEAAQASEYLVSTLKGFRAPASEAGNLLEVLNASSNTYATNVDELAQGMARLSPIASAMGLDFEGTANLLIPVIEVFRSGPEAANALRTGLLRLGDDSAPVVETLESIGVAQRDANGVLRDSNDILVDVANATSDMAESERLFVAQQLFGIEQSAKMVEVLKALDDATVDVGKAMKESATVSEEVATRLGTAEKAGERTAVAFENLARTIGVQFKDELAGVITAIGEVFREFEAAADAGVLDDFFAEVTPILGEIERLALQVAQALPQALAEADYSGFSDGLKAVFGGLEDVEIGVDDVKAVIEGLGDGFRALSEFTAGTFEVFAGFAAVVAPVIQAFLDLDSETQKWLGVLGGFSLVVSPVVGVLGTLTSAVGALAGRNGIVALATSSIGNMATRLAGTGALGLVGAAGAAIFALQQLYQEALAFNEFRFNFRNALDQLDQIQGAQRVATEFSLFQVEKIARAYNSLSDVFGWGDEAAADFDRVSEEAVDAAIQVANFAGATGDVGQAVDSTGAAILRGFQAWEQWTAAAESARLRTELATQAFDTNATTLWDHIDSLDGTSQAWERVGENTYQVARGLGEIDEALRLVQSQFDAGMIDEDTYNEMTRVLEGMRNESDRVALSQRELAGEVLNSEQAILAARQTVLDYKLELESLASNERIRKIELAVELGIAQLEADTRKFESIMESINTTITSTGELLGGEFGLFQLRFGGDVGRWDQLNLDKQIAAERKARDEAFDLQKEQIEASIKFMQAKTKALQNGDGLIKIDSDGLEPALEMIMWQILEKVQLRANAEGAEFLLGIGGTGGSDPDPDPGGA
ncbi:phage tail tape measure protein [Halomonas sp. H5]|uniref:phage tail tape measure protein n=1 Tax=Halomonas sp. H5 TaxID=3423910 RepID=UPI003D35B736